MRIAILFSSLVLVACGGSGSGSTLITFHAGGVSPNAVTLMSGAQVQFLNSDSVDHQIASTDCPELSSPELSAGETFTATPGAGPKSCSFGDGLNPSATAFQGTVAVALPSSGSRGNGY